jgi:hypothetical protein
MVTDYPADSRAFMVWKLSHPVWNGMATISAADHQAQAADLTVRLLRIVEGE